MNAVHQRFQCYRRAVLSVHTQAYFVEKVEDETGGVNGPNRVTSPPLLVRHVPVCGSGRNVGRLVRDLSLPLFRSFPGASRSV